ncbi:UDP-N-acetylglucosamine 2-epimerase (non-hydrolyzing) [Fervidibacter sacchari]|uniref:UDP-N-acetylglucosamine 2-epimerase (non-hydrolyzing) n=1 Tax=Candidatus Fervidibacter sacchari TaxID=1448929 RepID=A0ABT2EJ44_9BACT|nr:UDP-N-acetylglucosamine 2-epimerase (non-hydrolyzing) [Candidatus Fervidibacter sacchari]MCS3917974.1 UDP-N-acetylglucosamine 2-epimerase (non-hydrolyzing) [Candidatus Fervidibacter sacchari]WKU15790.1 UDP-N-acetylglucosamine 2-epimerase (non-hydrolyzing) [Candidatus Fervidibacter sacchari]
MAEPSRIKVMTIFGTRPEAIKMAPVVHALSADEKFELIITVTAQHREMLDQFLRFFGMQPRYDLNIMREGQTLADITSRAVEGIDKVLRDEKPDFVLVQGDTTTAFVGALVAYYHKIPCGHIEAGLRTDDKFAPFPEEINRKLIGAIADLHFAPTLRAKQNLLREGVPEQSIFVTGNTVVDALLWTLQRLPEPNRTSERQRTILVTAHRRENWGEPMERICKALRRIADKFPDVQIIFPMHKNPVVREVAYRVMGDHDRIKLCEPPDYFEFVRLMRDAYLIVTDSGGVQEEAPTLGKPVLVLREKTERPEAVEAGVVKVIGTDEERIVAEVSRLLSDEGAYRAMQRPVNPYGDGKAAMRIKQAILHFFGKAERPPDFAPQ